MTGSLVAATLLLGSLRCSAAIPTVPGAPFDAGTAEVVLGAATNQLPDSVWIYHSAKQEFSTSVVSNLMWLGGFGKRDATKSPRSDEIRDKEAVCYVNKEGTRRLGFYPSVGFVEYMDETALASMRESPKDIPTEEQAYELALKYLRFAGVDSSQLARKPGSAELRLYRTKTTRSYTDRKRGELVIDAVDLRGVCFVRWIDGIEFTGLGTAGGVLVEFGDEGKVHQLRANWRNFQPYRLVTFPTPAHFVERIRKGLAVAVDPIPVGIKKVTIAKAAPFYQGIGADEKQPYLYPFADMQLDLETDGTNHFLRVTCPIVVEQ